MSCNGFDQLLFMKTKSWIWGPENQFGEKCVEAIAANAVIAVIIEEAVICAAVSHFGYVFSICEPLKIEKEK